jgi:hypothetical protein
MTAQRIDRHQPLSHRCGQLLVQSPPDIDVGQLGLLERRVGGQLPSLSVDVGLLGVTLGADRHSTSARNPSRSRDHIDRGT